MNSITESFRQMLLIHGLVLRDEQMSQFDLYYNELITWNKKMNLTGITDKRDVYIKHFYDSIAISFFLRISEVNKLADIGSGAGFPSIPLKIMFPHLQVTIIDSLKKRIQFLDHLTTQLGLENVQCIHGRAEDVARDVKFRDQFDLVTARAVAKLDVLNELCLPFTAKGGLFVAYKGTDPEDELTSSAYSMKVLRAKLKMVHSFELPVELSKRHLVVLEKTDATPSKYPRKAGVLVKSPLSSDMS